MSKTDLNIPSLAEKFIDLRSVIPGDNYNWSWIRPLSQVNYLAIHHSAGPDTQTPDEIANYHINSNGWGGIGYHFLISKDGSVYYVGDISTARANVANLNEQVIGICLIGNFTQGKLPTDEQYLSAHNLCEFFINNYPDLSNVTSWEAVKGHKELPGQATTCPGDNWPNWRPKIISAIATVADNPPGRIIFNPPNTPNNPPGPSDFPERGSQITELYRRILGRDPDMGGLQTYTNGPLSTDQIKDEMINSKEHSQLIQSGKESVGLKIQVDSLQATLASVNQQVIFLQEAIQERDQQIKDLKEKLSQTDIPPKDTPGVTNLPPDQTLTLVGVLINLYKYIFMPGSKNL